MVASVPDDTSRRRSIDGTIDCTISPNSVSRGVGAPNVVPSAAVCTMAAMTSGSAWPRISGPHDATKSM